MMHALLGLLQRNGVERYKATSGKFGKVDVQDIQVCLHTSW